MTNQMEGINMEETRYKDKIKNFFKDGPWCNEPDEFYFDYKNYNCVGYRNGVGAWGGYVAIPIEDSFYQVHKSLADSDMGYEQIPIEVHGGITFGELKTDTERAQDFYIIGFDCAHSGDLYGFFDITKVSRELLTSCKEIIDFGTQLDELMSPLRRDRNERIYRDIEFAQQECRKMVDQIISFNESRPKE